MKYLIHMAISLTVSISLALAPPLFADTKAITLAADCFEPYYGDKLVNNGFVAEITREALKRSGYQLIIKFMPWERALKLSRHGKYAGVMAPYYTRDRSRYFAYSMPIAKVEVVLMSRKGANITYTALADLKPCRIGIIRGYFNTKAFDSADFLHKEIVGTNEQNLKKLINNRMDLIVNTKAVLQHFINMKMPDIAGQVEFVEPPLQIRNLYIIFSRKDPNHTAYVKALNSGYKAIKTDGTLDKIMARHGFK